MIAGFTCAVLCVVIIALVIENICQLKEIYKLRDMCADYENDIFIRNLNSLPSFEEEDEDDGEKTLEEPIALIRHNIFVNQFINQWAYNEAWNDVQWWFMLEELE